MVSRLDEKIRSAEPVNGRAPEGAGEPDATGNLRSIMHDLTELTELQAGLFMADAHNAWINSRRSLVGILTALVLAFASLPVVLIGVSFALAQIDSLPQWAAFLIVGLVGGTVPAGLLVWFSMKRLTAAAKSFERSTTELGNNLQWFKNTLKSHS